MDENKGPGSRLPHWMKMKRANGIEYSRIKNLVTRKNLQTICTNGNCPNIGECWSNGTATFMILGNICTRRCRFCAVETGKPLPADPGEPERLAETIRIIGIKHCVITSVDRDDLPDFGSGAWVSTIRQVRALNPNTTMEVLIPDFQGRTDCIADLITEGPDIISHNLETVERLTGRIRSKARYHTSLNVLCTIAQSGITAKSGIMLGLGEHYEEVLQTMDDLVDAGVKVLTLGQYLRPGPQHMPVVEYIHPEMFDRYRMIAIQKGFFAVESGPLVRSSYHAAKHIVH